MTAIISVLQRKQVSLITDSAGYNAAGVLAGFYRKTEPIPGLLAAVATRGAIELPVLMADGLAAMFDSFDAMISDGGAGVRSVYDDQDFIGDGERGLDLFLVGWSERLGKPAHRFLTSQPDHGVGVWTWVDLDEPILFAPEPDVASMIKANCRSLDDVEGFDLVKDGIRTMTAQRYMRGQTMTGHKGAEVHCVGGDVLLTTVTQTGVEQRVIHHWNDQVGEKIDPFNGEQDNAVLGMNRQQRRALERQQRKGAA